MQDPHVREFRDRLALVNDHRVAVGRSILRLSTTTMELARHEFLIGSYAPYGSDPWAKYDLTTRRQFERSHQKPGPDQSAPDAVLSGLMVCRPRLSAP